MIKNVIISSSTPENDSSRAKFSVYDQLRLYEKSIAGILDSFSILPLPSHHQYVAANSSKYSS